MTFRKRLPNLKLFLRPRILKYLSISNRNMELQTVKTENETLHSITEGSACIKTTGKVFYNPVQEFNRDLRLELCEHITPQLSTFFSAVFRC